MTDSLLFDSADDRADAGAFLTRVARLDRAGLVRLRQIGTMTELWAWLPLDVLVTRRTAARVEPPDLTVSAADLLTRLETDLGAVSLPPSRDSEWRGALPASGGWSPLETVPAADLLAIVHAGGEAFRSAAVSADPARVGEALLDHESLTVTGADATVTVPLRVLQALARMGFLRPDGGVIVAISRGWLRCDAAYGSAYRRRESGLSLSPV